MEELLATVDSIAFDQLEKRLWDYLCEKKRVLNTPLSPSPIKILRKKYTAQESLFRVC